MKKFVVLTIVALLAMACTASAFDGVRKGFVLGGGLGVAPVAKWEGDVIPFGATKWEESKAGVAVNFLIGYAWDEQNMIVADANVVAYQSDMDEFTFISQKPTVAQGFSGFSWYHYFGPAGKSWFSTFGLGTYSFQAEWEINNVTVEAKNEEGFGWLVGGGYEFSKHWQVGAWLSAGKTSEPGIDYDHMHLAVTIGGVAF